MLARAGEHLVGGDHADAGEQHDLDLSRRLPGQALLTAPGEAADVGRGVHGDRSHLVGEAEGLGHRVTPAHHQVGPPLPKGGAEVGQAVDEERGPVGHGEARGQDALVDHEQRHHGVGPARRLGQRRVVVDAEVAVEEDDDGSHRRGSSGWDQVPGTRGEAVDDAVDLLVGDHQGGTHGQGRAQGADDDALPEQGVAGGEPKHPR